MNDSRFEWKVGLFVVFGLALAALLILNFSKGIMLFQSTYRIHITMPTVAGLKPAADVMMAGVPVGKVAATTLSLDGRSVDITAEILAKYKIRQDARFHIDALGFLGDQYIEVTPAEGDVAAENKAPLLTNGQTIMGEKPLNMQEAVRSISGFVEQGQKTMQAIDQAVTNVNNTILNAAALTNFDATMTNFESATADTAGIAREVRAMLESNLPSVHPAITNLAALARKLNSMADQLDRAISTNTGDVTDAVKNIKAASASLQQLAEGLQAGQGLAGSLLKDEKMRADFATLLARINDMAEQFARFGQYLNQNGIWKALWKPKPSATNAPGR
jgi:phospholipid/cholesterol/gamma-HCH transport system substrate-binding protein